MAAILNRNLSWEKALSPFRSQSPHFVWSAVEMRRNLKKNAELGDENDDSSRIGAGDWQDVNISNLCHVLKC